MASAIPPSRHRLSVDQFHEMGRAGILPPDARVELVDGELIDMAPIGSRHAWAVAELVRLFVRQCGDAVVFPQNPIALPPYSEPQPDVAVLTPRAGGYRDALPCAAEVLLVVEVADATVRYDRLVKAGLYARHGIREFWVVDLPDGVLEIHRDPDGGVYRTRLTLSSSDTAVPEVLREVRIPLSPLLADEA